MHIPDGYLAPAVSLALAVPTLPVWALASRRVNRMLDQRTAPMLAAFSALSFTIMMFNIPVPGGTTAHGVGGTLIAIVLGPWAAVLAVSAALILQAFFFGDGGVLAIFANCFNLAVLLPVSGYWTCRLLSAGAAPGSGRRIIAAGIGAYVGLTVAAIAAGVELGLQPGLFSSDGHALYSPYGLNEAVPAMLVSHLFGASIVEGVITGLGLSYLMRHHPERLPGGGAEAAVAAGADSRAPARAGGRPLWQVALAVTAAAIAILGIAGLVSGGGRVERLFGADWSAVDWPAVASLLVVTAVVGLVAVPLAFALLPGPIKKTGTAFTALAVLAPLGLIAPGFAYGEGGADDVEAAFGYVPTGLQDVAGVFAAPFADYNLPLPFLSGADAELWHAALGYQLTGMIGILATGGLTFLLARLLQRRRVPDGASQVGGS